MLLEFYFFSLGLSYCTQFIKINSKYCIFVDFNFFQVTPPPFDWCYYLILLTFTLSAEFQSSVWSKSLCPCQRQLDFSWGALWVTFPSCTWKCVRQSVERREREKKKKQQSKNKPPKTPQTPQDFTPSSSLHCISIYCFNINVACQIAESLMQK